MIIFGSTVFHINRRKARDYNFFGLMRLLRIVLNCNVVDSFYVGDVVYSGFYGLYQDKLVRLYCRYLIFKLLLHAGVVEKYLT